MKLFPEWINRQWPEGSMGAADKKGEWAFCIGWTVAIIVVFILVTSMRGEGVPAHWKVMSWVTMFACIYAAWKYPDLTDSHIGYWLCLLIGLSLMVGFATGF